MKLSNDDIAKLNRLLKAAKVAGIDSIVIKDGLASGADAMHEHSQCALFSKNDIPNLTHKMGLSRLGMLRNNLEILKNEISIDAKENERGEISLLDISSGKTKFQFRCTATSLITAPVSISEDSLGVISITKEEFELISQQVRILSSAFITISIKPTGETIFSLMSVERDAVTIGPITNSIEFVESTSSSMTCHYAAPFFLSIAKAAGDDNGFNFIFGVEGMLTFNVEGHDIFLLQRINTD